MVLTDAVLHSGQVVSPGQIFTSERELAASFCVIPIWGLRLGSYWTTPNEPHELLVWILWYFAESESQGRKWLLLYITFLGGKQVQRPRSDHAAKAFQSRPKAQPPTMDKSKDRNMRSIICSDTHAELEMHTWMIILCLLGASLKLFSHDLAKREDGGSPWILNQTLCGENSHQLCLSHRFLEELKDPEVANNLSGNHICYCSLSSCFLWDKSFDESVDSLTCF